MLNKKILSGLVLTAASLISVAAQAQVYVGATAGKTTWGNPCWGGANCSSGTAYKFTAGYALNNNFALESSFFSLGDITRRSGSIAAPTIVTDSGKGNSLAGVFKVDLTEDFSGFAKLGVATIRTNANGNTTNALISVGAKYKLNQNASVLLELDQYRLKSNYQKPEVRTLNVGLQYAF